MKVAGDARIRALASGLPAEMVVSFEKRKRKAVKSLGSAFLSRTSRSPQTSRSKSDAPLAARMQNSTFHRHYGEARRIPAVYAAAPMSALCVLAGDLVFHNASGTNLTFSPGH